MALFGRNKNKGSAGPSEAPNPQYGQWEQLSQQVPYAGEARLAVPVVQENPEQQAKLMEAILSGDGQVLNRDDITQDLRVRDAYLEAVAAGEIGFEQKKKLLEWLPGPQHKFGAEGVLYGTILDNNNRQVRVSGIGQDKRLRKILVASLGLKDKDDKDGDKALPPEKVLPPDLNDFWRRYPTPADFEGYSQDCLAFIREHNPPQKYQEYQGAMNQFKRVMYGKRQAYWEQIQLLDQEAERVYGRNYQRPPRAGGAEAPEPVRVVAEQGVEMRGEQGELIKAAGHCEVSKAKVNAGIGFGERLMDDGSSEDSAVVLPARGLFGVFDGVGGAQDGRKASRTAAQAVEQRAEQEVNEPMQLWEMLDEASRAIIRATEEKGASTGVLAKVKEDAGGKKLMWASVGDSRLYVVHPDGKADLMTVDEGYENKITNALGGARGPNRDSRQVGACPLVAGDRVVLCSDGITGDVGSDLMRNEELAWVVHSARTADLAAEGLVRQARKRDDRTAIVFEV